LTWLLDRIKIPYIVWSTDTIDIRDPFQRCWLLRQTLFYGLAEDIGKLDLDEIEREIELLNLPNHIYSLWQIYFEYRKK